MTIFFQPLPSPFNFLKCKCYYAKQHWKGRERGRGGGGGSSCSGGRVSDNLITFCSSEGCIMQKQFHVKISLKDTDRCKLQMLHAQFLYNLFPYFSSGVCNHWFLYFFILSVCRYWGCCNRRCGFVSSLPEARLPQRNVYRFCLCDLVPPWASYGYWGILTLMVA